MQQLFCFISVILKLNIIQYKSFYNNKNFSPLIMEMKIYLERWKTIYDSLTDEFIIFR